MLSGESAAGKYPVNAVDTMAKINRQAEIHAFEKKTIDESFREVLIENAIKEKDLSYSVVSSAISLAEQINAKALVCLSLTGTTIKKVSSFRPMIPIIGCTTNEKSYRKTSILYGVNGMLVQERTSEAEIISDVVEQSINRNILKKGDTIVIIAGLPLGRTGTTNMIKVKTI